ncbi:hypothetical protein ACJJTC_011685 [Scirpophaga incertulas]
MNNELICQWFIQKCCQVRLKTGEATILLRAQHAPAPAEAARRVGGLAPALRRLLAARPAPEPRLAEPPAPAPTPASPALPHPHPHPQPAKDDADSPPDLKPQPDVIMRPLHPKAEPPDVTMQSQDVKSESELDVKCDVELDIKPKLEPELRLRVGSKLQPKEEVQCATERLAAACIARAVLLCRAQLYPGLHTILAAPGAGAGTGNGADGGAECDWCLARHGARRCLWYVSTSTCTPSTILAALSKFTLCLRN